MATPPRPNLYLLREKLIPFLLCGCFKPQDLADPNTEVIPFDNDFVTVDDAVIQRFDLTLKCPDGEPALVPPGLPIRLG